MRQPIKLTIICNSCIHKTVCKRKEKIEKVLYNGGRPYPIYYVDEDLIKHITIDIGCDEYSKSRMVPAPKPVPSPR